MAEPKDTAGVIAPPPLIALTAVIFGFAFERLLPTLAVTSTLPLPARIVIGVALMTGGAALAVAGRNAFVAHDTDVNPYKPANVLVTTGIFAHLRNPMYVGLALLVAGIGIAFASVWTVVMVVPQMLIIHYGVVEREERYLEAKFGESYRRYKASVPRYGLPTSFG